MYAIGDQGVYVLKSVFWYLYQNSWTTLHEYLFLYSSDNMHREQTVLCQNAGFLLQTRSFGSRISAGRPVNTGHGVPNGMNISLNNNVTA